MRFVAWAGCTSLHVEVLTDKIYGIPLYDREVLLAPQQHFCFLISVLFSTPRAYHNSTSGYVPWLIMFLMDIERNPFLMFLPGIMFHCLELLGLLK